MSNKLRTLRVKQELVEAAKKTLEKRPDQNLAQFVAEAIQLRLDELKQIREKTSEKPAEYPLIHERLLYSPNHIWAMVTPEGNITLGLSNYAQEHLKGIASIQTHPVGYKVNKGDPFGAVETWMFMFDLIAPVSGKIIKINQPLLDDPFTISQGPNEILWIAEIEPNNLIALEEELRDLININRYKMLVLKRSRPRILSI